LAAQECAAGQRAIDGHRRLQHQTAPGERHQGQLVVVLKQDGDIAPPDYRDQLRGERGDQMRRRLMCSIYQRAQEPLTKPLRAVDRRTGWD